ncbi:MAG: hypothetical protein ACMUJM_24545 [bacterium]
MRAPRDSIQMPYKENNELTRWENSGYYPSQIISKVVLELRGKYINKNDDIILRMLSFLFIIVGINCITEIWIKDIPLSIKSLNGWELIGCFFLFMVLGIVLLLASFIFYDFTDKYIHCYGIFKKQLWSIKKQLIDKIELVAERERFYKNIFIYITHEGKVDRIPLNNRTKRHIEKISGLPINKFIVQTIYPMSPKITFGNVLNILEVLAIIAWIIYRIFLIL